MNNQGDSIIARRVLLLSGALLVCMSLFFASHTDSARAAVTEDWGDAPDSYGTTSSAGGPHHVIVLDLQLGNTVEEDADGQPSPNADGDALGDDGVSISDAVAGTDLNVEAYVANSTGSPATLVGWIDLNGNGEFDAAEGRTTTVASAIGFQLVTLTFAVPNTADIDTGGVTYARFRITTDAITVAQPGGGASDGEVEDYRLSVLPPSVAIQKTDGLLSLSEGQTTTYSILLQYSGLTGITRTVNDVVNPVGAFVAGSLVWTCDANSQASCVTGQPLGTDVSSPVAGLITGQSVDLEQGGVLIFSVSGQLLPNFLSVFSGTTRVINTVSLNTGESAVDDNEVTALTGGVINVAPTLLMLMEGMSGTYAVSLSSTPLVAPVTIQLSFDSAEISVNGSASPVLLTFNNTSAQTITVTALTNAVNENRSTLITQQVSASSSADYPVGLQGASVTVNISDEMLLPTAIPTLPPPPPTPLCADHNFNAEGVVRSSSADALGYAINCRVLYQNGAATQWLGGDLYSGANIGVEGVVALGVQQAVDIFSPAGQTYFQGGGVFCLKGSGTLIWLAASHAPRVAEIIGSYTVPEFAGYTCATLFEPGTLVLVRNVPAS